MTTQLAETAGLTPYRSQNAAVSASAGSISATPTASAGAEITQAARGTFYGGYAGYFRDPDGHVWEIAYNPGFPLGPDGSITVPDFGAS